MTIRNVTVYVLGDVLAADCDTCHESVLPPGQCVGIGSQWLAEAVAAHDSVCPVPCVVEDYETARITITRVLTTDGDDLHYVEATPGMGLVEALGLMRLAEDTLIKFPPAEEPENDDEEPTP